MGFGLIHLFEAGLLVANAMAILNERRFLVKFGELSFDCDFTIYIYLELAYLYYCSSIKLQVVL